MFSSIFRLKFKLHRLLNVLFYLFFFALGFIVGGGNLSNIKNIVENSITQLMN